MRRFSALLLLLAAACGSPATAPDAPLAPPGAPSLNADTLPPPPPSDSTRTTGGEDGDGGGTLGSGT